MPSSSSWPAIVIGLARREDRRAAITAMLRALALDPRTGDGVAASHNGSIATGAAPGAEITVRFAVDLGLSVDWQDWNEADVARLRARAFPWCRPDSTIGWWNRELKLGEMACALSHWNVWTFARAERAPGLIVLEDDGVPQPAFAACAARLRELERLDPSWDLLYLGRAPVQPNQRDAGEAFVVPGFSYCTHGYALSARGIDKLLATDLPNALIPVDEFLCAMYLDHPREDVRGRFSRTLTAYALREDAVLRRARGTVESDTEDSPFLQPAAPGGWLRAEG